MGTTTQPWYVALILIIISDLLISLGDANNIKCIESEKYALLSFKNGLEDTDDMLFSWRIDNVEDCCNWRGVKCSNLTGHVVELVLRGSNSKYLSGNIDPSLLELSHLNYLDLSNNDFTDIPIPNYIGSLVNLRYLNLSGSGFYGTVPPHLGNLSSLETLDLHGLYSLQNSKSLEWHSHLSCLKYLDLSNINLENSIDWMHFINKLSYLKTLALVECELPNPTLFPSYDPFINNNISTSISKLDLLGNHLTSSIFSWLSNFNSSLVHLDLSINNFQGYIPPAFGNMTSLSYIDFGFNQLEGVSPKSLWNFRNLRSLSFPENNFGGMFSDFLQLFPRGALDSIQNLDFTHNKFSGSLPDFSKFPNLAVLDLSSNSFSGRIPISLGQLSNLEALFLRNNSLEGIIYEPHFSNVTKLRSIDLSHNSLSFQMHSNWVPPFQLKSIVLSSCKLGPNFPQWLRGQNYSYLDLSNTSISDTIPYWFWNYFSSSSASLDLSHNQIRGELPTLSTKSIGIRLGSEVNLRSNYLKGEIPEFFLLVGKLDVSNNKFSGLTHLCEINTISSLYFLDASNNEFMGEVPNCWWNVSYLKVLSLANNGFSGGIPSSFSNLNALQSLYLHDNRFSGECPSWLKNFNDLQVLDLGVNKLTGAIPTWIGIKLTRLLRLSLRSNQFDGALPSTLCHLNHILFLDLSLNNIMGVIPNCLHNLTSLRGLVELNKNAGDIYLFDGRFSQFPRAALIHGEMIVTWKGREFNMKEILPLLRSIDLSGNRLTGKIPNEITELDGLVSLNLSRNNLRGGIPENIGRLKLLDFMDLSRNELVGEIPLSVSQISGLSVMDLSWNKLSGKIPTGTQLQSFSVSSYEGNLDLCGSPLPKCVDGETVPDSSYKILDVAYEEDEFKSEGFYVSAAIGFVVGFWGICGTLMFFRSFRHAYFGFLTSLNDWFYVNMTIFKNNFFNH